MKKIQKSLIREMMRRATESGAIMLAQGVPGLDTPQNIKDAGIQAIQRGLTQYTPMNGLNELRNAISKKLLSFNKIRADPEGQVIVTCGAMEGLASTLLALLEKGDEVIAFSPFFASYKVLTELAGGVFVESILTPPEFKINWESLESCITKGARVIILCTPNNPTGKVFSKQELSRIAKIAEEKDLLIIADEIYENLIFEGEHFSVGSIAPERTITIGSFSKSYSMSGWRVGYLCGPKKIVAEINNAHMHIGVCAPAMAQAAAIEALLGPQDSAEKTRLLYKENRDFAVKRLNELGLSCKPPAGAYYIFANCEKTGMNGLQLAEFLLEKANVAVVPGIDFGKSWKDWIRISFSAKKEELLRGLEAIAGSFAHKP